MQLTSSTQTPDDWQFLDLLGKVDTDNADLAMGVKWVFLGDVERKRLTIPRELLRAVQLLPWKFVGESDGKTSTWVVQGLLVLGSSEEDDYHQLSIRLTGDFIRAARLMASTLHVPYLFCADSEDWKAEEFRTKSRSPLRTGGTQS